MFLERTENPAGRLQDSALFWGVVVFGALFAYLLSPVPVVGTLDRLGLGESEHVRTAARAFYQPIIWAYERSPAVKSAYDWYGKTFDVHR